MRLKRTAAAFALILGITVSVVAFARMAEDRKANQLIQEGRNAELVADLPVAIERYLLAVQEAEAGNNRELAAKALFQLGMAYQKKSEARAAATFDRIVRDYGDQPSATEARKRAIAIRGSNSPKPADAGYTDVSELRNRTIWQDEKTDTTGRVSPDGRYLSFVDRSAGDALAVRDLFSRSDRTFAKPGSGTVGASAISPDGKRRRRIAYAWRSAAEANAELRVVGVDGSQDRSVYSNVAVERIQPVDWTPDGTQILVQLSTHSGVTQIAVVDAEAGRLKPLKTFAGPVPANITLSPDGRYIAFDIAQTSNATARDIFVFDSDLGIRESLMVPDPGNEAVLGWTPDSKRLLFAGERSGQRGVWSVNTLDGKTPSAQPLFVTTVPKGIQSLGITQSGSLFHTVTGREVGVIEGLLPELARLELTAMQQPQPAQALLPASLEGVVVKLGTNEPVAGAELELLRVQGVASFPLNAGAAEAFARTQANGGLPVLTQQPLPPLAPEVQYTKTGTDGKFVFRNLKPGGYRLVAARNADSLYPAEYGQRDPRGRGLIFSVGEGETMRDAKLEMAPTSVITGRITDDGEPAGEVTVLAMRVQYRGGRRMTQIQQAVVPDERGNYRFYWLPPGSYLIAATMPPRPFVNSTPPGRLDGAERLDPPTLLRTNLPTGEIVEETTRPIYYGGEWDSEKARLVELRAGTTLSGIDIPLPLAKIPSRHIRGVLMDPAGQPARGVQVRAVPQKHSPYLVVPSGTTDANGAFDLAGVARGSYSLFAPFTVPTPGPAQPNLRVGVLGFANVDVGDSDVDKMQIVAAVSMDLPGTVRIESGSRIGDNLNLANLRISIAREPDVWGMPQPSGLPLTSPAANLFANAPQTSVVTSDGNFKLLVSPGDYHIAVTGLPSDMYVSSIRIGAVEVLDKGLHVDTPTENALEVVIKGNGGSITGISLARDLKVMSNVVVALVPEQPLRERLSFYRSTTTDENGKFQFTGIAPGDYKLFAWEFAEPGSWQDPHFLQPYESLGKLIRVGESTRQDLQVTVIPITGR